MSFDRFWHDLIYFNTFGNNADSIMHLKLLFLLCTKEPLSETQENRLTQMPTKNRTKLIGRNRENGNRVVCSYLSTYVRRARQAADSESSQLRRYN